MLSQALLLTLAMSGLLAAAAPNSAPAAPQPAQIRSNQASRHEIVKRAEARLRWRKRQSAPSATPVTCGSTTPFLIQTNYPEGSSNPTYLRLYDDENPENTSVMAGSGAEGATAWYLASDCTLVVENRIASWATYSEEASQKQFSDASQIFTVSSTGENLTNPSCRITGDSLTCSDDELATGADEFAIYHGENGDALVIGTDGAITSNENFTPTTLHIVRLAVVT